MDHTIVVLGTGRIVPGIAAAFSPIAASVTIAGRGAERARAAARPGERARGREIHAGAIDAETLARRDARDRDDRRGSRREAALLELIEPWIADDALIVSNTSSLLLDEIAASLRNRPRFAGWHVMFPAHLTRVLEIVRGRADLRRDDGRADRPRGRGWASSRSSCDARIPATS